MEKRISKRKEQERKELLLKTKKRRLILTLSSLPPFILTVVFIVLYALRIHFAWLTGLTSLLWLLLGGLFIYAERKDWGRVNSKGVKTPDSNSVVTIYNIVLVFLLGAFFLAIMLYKIF